MSDWLEKLGRLVVVWLLLGVLLSPAAKLAGVPLDIKCLRSSEQFLFLELRGGAVTFARALSNPRCFEQKADSVYLVVIRI